MLKGNCLYGVREKLQIEIPSANLNFNGRLDV